MRYEWDNSKNLTNQNKHGVAFESVELFEWDSAVVFSDTRQDYGEARYNALGYIGLRIHNLTYTKRASVVRVISLRKANSREVERYAKA